MKENSIKRFKSFLEFSKKYQKPYEQESMGLKRNDNYDFETGLKKHSKFIYKNGKFIYNEQTLKPIRNSRDYRIIKSERISFDKLSKGHEFYKKSLLYKKFINNRKEG